MIARTTLHPSICLCISVWKSVSAIQIPDRRHRDGLCAACWLRPRGGSRKPFRPSLGVSQPTLTRHLGELEQSLGAPLLHRTGRGVVLTEAGRRALTRARSALLEIERMRAEVTSERQSPSGPVSLGMLASVAERLIPALVLQVQASFPDIRLRVREGFSAQVEAWLASGEVDLGIFNTARAARRGAFEPLFSSPLLLVGPPNAQLNSVEPLRVLEGRGLILPATGNNIRRTVEEACARIHVMPQVIFELDSIHSIRRLVAAGVGWSLLPEHAVIEQAANGQLKVARIREPALIQHILLAPTRRWQPSSAAKAVMRIVREVGRAVA
nr:LysR substrate-binding domain-containing protein [Roseococcus sp. MDT2-1-1]